MANRIVLNPVSYHGAGAVKEIGGELSRRGFKRAFIASGRHVVKSGEITLPELDRPSYLAVGINGEHEDECVYCVAECEGRFYGFPRRAPDYKANHWEHWVRGTDENHTFFMDIPEELSGKTVTVRALLHNAYKADVQCDVYLCDKH